MDFELLTNNNIRKLKYYFEKNKGKYDKVLIASAFLSETDVLEYLKQNKISIKLVVSLRFPTSYECLKNLSLYEKTETKFILDNDHPFHSKFYIFIKEDKPIAGIIGSSNFTDGGLRKNIETNLYSENEKFLKDLQSHFSAIFDKAYDLEPSDLEKYKISYDAHKKASVKDDEILEELIKNRNASKTNKISISKEAETYLQFWKIINEIKTILNNELKLEYPNIPEYLVIDQFLYWIKKKGNIHLDSPDEKIIKNKFCEFAKLDKEGKNDTEAAYDKAKNIFNKFLSKDNIKALTVESAKEIYKNLHTQFSRTNRFESDEKFVEKNEIEKIRNSLEYLLYSNDDVKLKISHLINSKEYKLEGLGSSSVQELLGWVFYDKYPIRNDTPTEAIKLLGFKID